MLEKRPFFMPIAVFDCSRRISTVFPDQQWKRRFSASISIQLGDNEESVTCEQIAKYLKNMDFKLRFVDDIKDVYNNQVKIEHFKEIYIALLLLVRPTVPDEWCTKYIML